MKKLLHKEGSSAKNIVVTAALPYANYNLHLGHLRSTYIPADIYVRYMRLRGENVIYICATDEHGTPITVMAEKSGVSPKEIVDRYHQADLADLQAIGCSFDFFGRTTLPTHYWLTQEFFRRLLDKGYIYEAEVEQLFCPKDEHFLPDRFVEGVCPHCGGDARGDQCEGCGRYLKPTELRNPRCVLCGMRPASKKTRHWFFRLGAFEGFLREWLKNNSGLSANVRNYASRWLSEGLNDWCITRDMEWGVPVPVEDAGGKVVYVWFDAPIGYISNTIEFFRRTGEPERWRDFWQNSSSEVVHFIGKDIIYHHALFWPAMLRGVGDYNLPSSIIAGEYLTLGGRKMSKSRGWMVEVGDYLRSFDPDPLRYYLIVASPLSKDADFTWEEFVRRNNDELADIIGNFIHRSLVFTYQFFDGKIPQPGDNPPIQLLDKAEESVRVVGELIERHEFHHAMREILELAAEGNRFLNMHQPWRTYKENPEAAGQILYVADQAVKSLGILLAPFLPFTADKLWKILNLPGSVHRERWENAAKKLEPGHKINRPVPLFRKIRMDEVPKAGS